MTVSMDDDDEADDNNETEDGIDDDEKISLKKDSTQNEDTNQTMNDNENEEQPIVKSDDIFSISDLDDSIAFVDETPTDATNATNDDIFLDNESVFDETPVPYTAELMFF